MHGMTGNQGHPTYHGPAAHFLLTANRTGTPCWACGRPTGCCTFFCACGKIQPVVGDCSYFETFHMCVRADSVLQQKAAD